jgi:hypothetical protein
MARLLLHDLRTGRHLRTVPIPGGDVCYSADGRTFLHADEWGVTLRESLSGKARWQMHLSRLELGKFQTNSLCLLRQDTTGRHAVVVREQDAYLFDTLTGQIKVSIPLNGSGKVCGVSASGRWLAVEGVSVFDLEGKSPADPVVTLPMPRVDVRGLAVNADGTRLISAHGDGTCLVWDLARLRGGVTGPKSADDGRLWEQLANEDPAEAQEAIVALAKEPGRAVRLFTAKLCLVTPIPRARIAAWVAQLDSSDFPTRKAAIRDLEAAKEQAAEALREAADKAVALEVRLRARRLLEQLDDLAKDGERMRQLRAVEVLERIGTKEAVALLEKLAGGAPAATLTREANASLRRLRR